MKVEIGAPAPEFSLKSDAGETVTLSALRGKKVVLFFYPKDDTPGCTSEAKDFSAELSAFADAGATVIGMSRDSLASHAKFRTKHKLTVTLLSDPDLVAHNAYGVWGEKKLYGRTFEGTIRSTVLIDEDGDVDAVWSPVKVPGHAKAVLAAVKGETEAVAAPVKKAAPAKKTTKAAKTK